MSARLRTCLIGAAILAAVLPLPEKVVERWYSGAVYPRLQHVLTKISNTTALAMFDALWIGALVATVLVIVRAFREAGVLRGSMKAGIQLVTAGALIYLLFLATWGLNYRRVSLQDKLQYDASRLTPSATSGLATRATSELNRLYREAHATPVSIDHLASSFHDAERALHAPTSIVPSRPKPTLLGGYFHSAAIAGMTDPFFLETLLAPDLLDVERPFVIAHEWGHLAGYADESEANFIAWLACLRSDPQAQYSAWLTLFGHIYGAVGNKRDVIAALGPGPRIDLQAISDRYAGTPRLVRFAARETYDRYLKVNRVERGVESYDEVVELILGTTFDSAGNPGIR